jgi:hypothetical protein
LPGNNFLEDPAAVEALNRDLHRDAGRDIGKPNIGRNFIIAADCRRQPGRVGDALVIAASVPILRVPGDGNARR